MPTSKRHKDSTQEQEDHEHSADETPGEKGEGSGLKRKTGRPSLLRRAIQAHKKFKLSEADQDICWETLKIYQKAPLGQRSAILSRATKKILGLYQAKHGKPASQVTAKSAQDAAAKLGTKAYNERNVWLSLNKDKVPDKVKELETLEKHQGKPPVALLQLAVSELMKGMPQEERADLKIAASEWNATGPVEEVRKK
ncbi:hypothetical protein H1R20_g11487, partial [Candolleomyces eurysporus]